MMKTVLISIRAKWWKLILSGGKDGRDQEDGAGGN